VNRRIGKLGLIAFVVGLVVAMVVGISILYVVVASTGGSSEHGRGRRRPRG